MRWYVPSWNGDIRFESIDEEQTLVTMIKPTRSEIDRLVVMERVFFARGWIKGGLWDPQRADSIQACVVNAPLLAVGERVIESYVQGEAVLTAIRYENDEVHVVEAGKGFWKKIAAALRMKSARTVAEDSEIRTDVAAEVEKREAERRAREAEAAAVAAARTESERAAAEARAHEARKKAEAEAVAVAKRRAERLAEQAEVDRREAEEVAAHKAAGRLWFISLGDGKTDGPMTEAALRELFEKKKVGPDTKISRYGWKNWHPLADTDEFADLTPKVKVVATVKKPTSCCPTCVHGPMSPEKEVLFAFLSDDEKRQWAKDHSIVVIGGITGHEYLLSHRNGIWAARHTKICHDIDDDVTLHFHDNTVPPEEEVLAAKLILEHREHWLRHEATHLSAGMKFKNPFGDGSDGIPSALFTRAMADALMDVHAGTRGAPECL